jgi:hypothetical protein
MTFKIWACALACVTLALTVEASACPKGDAQFNDDFSATVDPAWSYLSDNGKADGGHLVIALGPQKGAADSSSSNHSLNQTNVYTDATVCLDFAFKDTKDPDNTNFGVAFWGVDDNHFYTLEINMSGYYQLARKVNDQRWLYPIPWTKSTLVKQDMNAPQEIIVTTKGNVVSVTLNGTKIADSRGQAPDGGGTVGLYWTVPNKDGAQFTVSQIQVTN